MWFQRLSTHTLFLGSKCCFLPRIIHPMCNRFPFKSLMFTGGVFLDVLLYYNQKVAEFSKILKLFIHAHLLTRDDVRWYFPGLCGVSERTIWHSRQASATTFPHVSHSWRVMIVLRLSLYGVVSDGRLLGLFVPLPPAVLTGFPQGASISLEAGFGRIVFLKSAVFVVFHSRYQRTLISVPTSIRPSWLQGLSPHTLFLGSKGWLLHNSLHPMWNRGPQCKGCCSLEVDSWTLCFITTEKGFASSKILNLFIHAPLLTRDDDRWYFPGLCGVTETTMWNSRQDAATTFPHVSLFTKGDDCAKMVPVRCCFWRTCIGPVRSIAASSFDRISQEANISLEAGFGRFVFLSAVFVVFHSGTKAPWLLYRLP